MASILAACGGGEEAATLTAPTVTSTTIAPTTTTSTSEATTTTAAAAMTVPQIELLSGMLQALLTTEEIGNGWVDVGRSITPFVDGRGGFLCPEGQAIADSLGSTFDPMVSTRFRSEAVEPNVTEDLLPGPAAQIEQDYATWISALDACAGSEPWDVPDLGTVQMERIEVPSLGSQSVAYAVEASATRWRAMDILLSPGDPPIAGVVRVQINSRAALDPALEEEWMRIAGAAVAKLEPGLAEAEPFTIEYADPEELATLGYLMQGLLTTEEIGGGWVDQGRALVPPSASGQDRFGGDVLCPEGQALFDPIGSGLDSRVFTFFAREDSTTVSESLIWGRRDQLTEDFATGVAALEACFGREPWETEEAGAVRMDRLDLPSLGAQSIAYSVSPGGEVGADPWAEWRVVSILVTDLDPGNDDAVVISLSATTIHDPPDQPAPTLEDEELTRIAGAAVARWEYNP